MIFFVLFTALLCSDSILNLLKRGTDGSSLFLYKTLVFLFLPFLNSGIQIRCPQNRHADLKSALDQLGGEKCQFFGKCCVCTKWMSQTFVMYKLLTFEASVNNNLESFTKHCNGTVTLITCGKVTSVKLKWEGWTTLLDYVVSQ